MPREKSIYVKYLRVGCPISHESLMPLQCKVVWRAKKMVVFEFLVLLVRTLRKNAMQWTPQTSATNLQLMYSRRSTHKSFKHIYKVIYYSDNLILHLFRNLFMITMYQRWKIHSSLFVCKLAITSFLLCINKSSSNFKKRVCAIMKLT